MDLVSLKSKDWLMVRLTILWTLDNIVTYLTNNRQYSCGITSFFT
jgi:hypothetical protein